MSFIGPLQLEEIEEDVRNWEAIYNTNLLKISEALFQGKSSRIEVVDEDYDPSALTEDYLIAISTLSSSRNITISKEDIACGTVSLVRKFIIKDESGLALMHNIIVQGEDSLIDGEATYIMDQNYQSITIYSDGTSLYII